MDSDIGYLPDVVRMDIVDFGAMPDKAMRVLSLRMIGLGSTKIGRILKMTKASVEDYLKRYDPNGECKVDHEMKRKITSAMLMGVGVEALVEITDEKLRSCDAKELAQIATRCVSTAEKIRALGKRRQESKTKLESAMDYFDQLEVKEA